MPRKVPLTVRGTQALVPLTVRGSDAKLIAARRRLAEIYDREDHERDVEAGVPVAVAAAMERVAGFETFRDLALDRLTLGLTGGNSSGKPGLRFAGNFSIDS